MACSYVLFIAQCYLSETNNNKEFSFASSGENHKQSVPQVLLAELAGIPRTFHPPYLRASNGYFNCEIEWDSHDAISSVG